ncbi:TRAP transporter small permease [Salibacterium salarium]|uniref:TRAP transporter small permease n=1 Tax=Salibacterium salarium TaxID=284579 RepID=A0A428N1Z4_9BACI|nr:TRAP transporter small permease [Salibacterium salarium]RSL32338.1 TRAP transporter small permease [Salibacterium salarium]
MNSSQKEVEEQNRTPRTESPGTSSFFSKMERTIYLLNNITHGVAMTVLFLMMCLTTVDVLGRYFFSTPITGAFEVTGLGLAILVFFSLGMTQLKGDHISIDFLTSKFPKKVQEVLNIFTSLAVLIIVLFTSWQLVEYAKRLTGQTSGELPLPLSIFAILAAVGVLFFALTIMLSMLNSVMKVVQKDES